MSPVCDFMTHCLPLWAAGRLSFLTSRQLSAFAHACLTWDTVPPSLATLGFLLLFGWGGSAGSVPAPPQPGPVSSPLSSGVLWDRADCIVYFPVSFCRLKGRAVWFQSVFSMPSLGACRPSAPACWMVTKCSWVDEESILKAVWPSLFGSLLSTAFILSHTL